jgi:hypothetical protein
MILHRGDRERSQHKPYVIGWERDRGDVVASFDTLSAAISAIHNRTVRGLRLDRRYVVRYGGRIVWQHYLSPVCSDVLNLGREPINLPGGRLARVRYQRR